MNHNQNERALDQALADLYAEQPSLRFENSWRQAVKREEQMQMKRKNNRWIKTVLPIAAALVLILGAGWAGQLQENSEKYSYLMDTQETRSSKSVSFSEASYSSGSTSSGTALTGSYSASSSVNYAVEESADYESASYGTLSADTGAGSVELTATDDRKLIRTVDLSLRTENFQQDVEGIQQLLSQYGGYIESLYQQGEEGSYYGRSANLTMRVPSEHLDAFLTGLSGFGRVVSRSETTEDMTEQYTDNEVRIQTLQTKLERLNTLLAQAEDVSDILEIESEIADTQYQLERYETKQLNIDRRVDMSYVYVNVQETVTQDAVDDEELTLGQRLKAALKASIEGLGRFGRNLLVFLTMALPVIVPVAIVWVIVLLVKRGRKGKQPEQNLPAEADENMEDTNEENE